MVLGSLKHEHSLFKVTDLSQDVLISYLDIVTLYFSGVLTVQ
jgi:hypothetical protein